MTSGINGPTGGQPSSRAGKVKASAMKFFSKVAKKVGLKSSKPAAIADFIPSGSNKSVESVKNPRGSYKLESEPITTNLKPGESVPFSPKPPARK